MRIAAKRIVVVLALSLFLNAQGRAADGLPYGQVLVSYNETGGTSAVCLFNPNSGSMTASWSPSQPGATLGDVVFSPALQTAFVVLNPSTTASSILQLTEPSPGILTASPLLTGLDNVQVLAADHAGNLFFDEKDPNSMYQQIMKINQQGQVSAVTQSPTPFGYFFEPQHMVASRDGSTLYVTEEPENRVDVVDVASGRLSNAGHGAATFLGGITVDGAGDLLVTRDITTSGGTLDDIASVSLSSGSATTYLCDPTWMPFLTTGFWDDLAYDEFNNDLYAAKGRYVYAIDSNLNSRLVYTFGLVDTPAGIDVIQAPEPGTATLLAAGISATGVYVWWRRRKTRRPTG